MMDFVTCHVAGPQDSDSEDESNDNEETPVESEILAAARRRWGRPTTSPPSSAPAPPTPPPTLSPNTPHALGSGTNVDHATEVRCEVQKTKKKKLHRKSCKIKREVMREVQGVSKSPKAVVLACVCQASPVPVDLRMQSDALPVASTGWMGLHTPPPLPFESESREYSLEEAREIPGMRVVDWQGYVPTYSP